jgi:hypothetical protein
MPAFFSPDETCASWDICFIPSGRTNTERRLLRIQQRLERIYTPCKIEKVPTTRLAVCMCDASERSCARCDVSFLEKEGKRRIPRSDEITKLPRPLATHPLLAYLKQGVGAPCVFPLMSLFSFSPLSRSTSVAYAHGQNIVLAPGNAITNSSK